MIQRLIQRRRNKMKMQDKPIMERVSIVDVIHDLTNNYPLEGKQRTAVSKVNLSENLKDILTKQQFPFDIGGSDVYLVESRLPLAEGSLGHLLVKGDLILFGANWYGPGKAVNSEFAYRQGDEIALGYMNETCRITDDRQVESDIDKDSFRVFLPERYNLDELFSGVPGGFTEIISRGTLKYSTFGPRVSVFCARVLAGMKFDQP